MATVTKVTLWGPPPFGGSITASLTDPIVTRLLADGWVEHRRWEVRPCQWFALCDRSAQGVAHHPVLDPVPICPRCAEQAGVELHPFDCGCDVCVADPFDTNEEARGER